MISEKDIVYITKKQASVATAVIAMLGLFIFMLGYFWGKQSAIGDLKTSVTQSVEQDEVDYLQTMQSFAQKNPSYESKLDETKETIEQPAPKKEDTATNKSVPQKNIKRYHAILIGFGAKTSATQFADRLKKHNIDVDIKSRISKSSSGKTKRAWYQAVTKSYESKKDLQAVVDRIKKLERIKESDIKII